MKRTRTRMGKRAAQASGGITHVPAARGWLEKVSKGSDPRKCSATHKYIPIAERCRVAVGIQVFSNGDVEGEGGVLQNLTGTSVEAHHVVEHAPHLGVENASGLSKER